MKRLQDNLSWTIEREGLKYLDGGYNQLRGQNNLRLRDTKNMSQGEQYWNYMYASFVVPLYKLEQEKLKLKEILFSEEGKSKIEPKYKAINIIEKEKRNHGKDYKALTEALKYLSEEIKKSDKELAIRINSIGTGSKKEYPILGRIIQILETYPIETIYRHFRINYGAYLNELNKINNPEVSEKIRKAILGFILKHSKIRKVVNIINSFKEKVDQWVIPYHNIDEYIKEGANFIKYMLTFNDPVINVRYRDPRIRQLLLYSKEKEFFITIWNQIEKGEHQGAWEDFEKFYKKVKEVSKEVKEVFGDVIDAKVLLELKKKFHESPEDWKRGIYSVLVGLDGRKGEIISQARSAFEEIFKYDLERIKALQQQNLEQFKEIIMGVTKYHKKQIAKDLKILFKAVRRKKRMFDEKIDKIRKEYIDEEKKKDEEGKTLSERRIEFIEQFIVLSENSEINLSIETAQRSWDELTKLVNPIVSLAGILRSRDNRYDAQARLIGFAAGARAADESIENSSAVLKRTIISGFNNLIKNGKILLYKTQMIVDNLHKILGLDSYKYS